MRCLGRCLGRLARRGDPQVRALYPTTAVRDQLTAALPRLPATVRAFAVDDRARLDDGERAGGVVARRRATPTARGWSAPHLPGHAPMTCTDGRDSLAGLRRASPVVRPNVWEKRMTDRFAPLTTPGCIVKARTVSLAFECRAEPTHAGLITVNDEVFLAFACPEHKSSLIAARRMLGRDRAELERRRHSWTWARVGHPPLPIDPLATGAAARRLVEKARVWATEHVENE